MKTKLTAAICVLALGLSATAPAFAFDCIVAKKPANAGSAVEINILTDEVTPLKRNPGTEDQIHGGFIAVTDGGELSSSTFAHAPQGVLPPTREGGSQANCDGKGLDSAEACFGP